MHGNEVSNQTLLRRQHPREDTSDLLRVRAVTGSMTVARFFDTATLLPNGGVLITGGTDGTNVFSSAELYQ